VSVWVQALPSLQAVPLATLLMTHFAWQVPAFCSWAVWQASGAVQLVGQAPGWPAAILVSQVSLQALSTTPFPQLQVQSTSLVLLHPAGQQPSLVMLQAVIAVCVQFAVHVPPFTSAALSQALVFVQLVGQAPVPEAIAVSQLSPVSKRPLPQQGTIGVCVHLAVQAAAVPE
jgi:hypothetical protein